VFDLNTVPEPEMANATRDEPKDELRKSRIENARKLRRNVVASVVGKIYAEIEVGAFDDDAAESLAENELRTTLDVLNYFGEFFSDSGARVFLPGEANVSRHVGILSKKGSFDGTNSYIRTKVLLSRFRFPHPIPQPKYGRHFQNPPPFYEPSLLISWTGVFLRPFDGRDAPQLRIAKTRYFCTRVSHLKLS